jgi:hypothetical protein
VDALAAAANSGATALSGFIVVGSIVLGVGFALWLLEGPRRRNREQRQVAAARARRLTVLARTDPDFGAHVDQALDNVRDDGRGCAE